MCVYLYVVCMYVCVRRERKGERERGERERERERRERERERKEREVVAADVVLVVAVEKMSWTSLQLSSDNPSAPPSS